MRPIAHGRRRGLAAFTAFLLFASFVLLLFVAISLPIFKPVYLLSVHTSAAAGQPATSIATELRFGVWGFCATSVLDQPSLFTNNGDCTKPRLGYDVNTPLASAILNLTGEPQLIQALLKGLTVVLVLHPVCAGLALLTLLPALCLGARGPAIFALVFAVTTAIITTALCAVDIALVAVAKSKIPDLTDNLFDVSFGNAPWLSLAAVVLLWISVILLSVAVCGCCRGRQSRYDDRNNEK